MRRRVAVLTAARAALSLANGPCVVVTAKRPPMPQTSVSLLGIPHDANSSFMRGAAEAPALIRQELLSESRHLWTEAGRNLAEEGVLRDLGDLRFESDDQENGGSRGDVQDNGADDWVVIEKAVADAIADGQPLISLGGDHAITHPILRAVRRRHRKLTILHFDAHPDLYEDFGGDPLSHASPFARILERGLASRLVQVGIRTLNVECRRQVETYGVDVIEMRDFAPDRVPIPDAPLYISIDLDGLDPAFAPGVSHHEPGGLSVRELISVLHRVQGPIVGADIVEYNPTRDLNGVTAVVAAKLVKELAALAGRQ